MAELARVCEAAMGIWYTHNHGEAVGHGEQVGSSMLRTPLSEIAQGRGTQRTPCCRHATLVVFQSEFASIFADNRDIVPAKSFEAFASDLAKRWGEVNEIDAGEERRHIDELGHGLDIPASASANLEKRQMSMGGHFRRQVHAVTHIDPNTFLLAALFLKEFGLKLSCHKRQHILTATQENLACGIIGTCLPLVEALQSILLGTLGIALMRLEKGRVEEEEEGLQETRAITGPLVMTWGKSGDTYATNDGNGYASVDRVYISA